MDAYNRKLYSEATVFLVGGRSFSFGSVLVRDTTELDSFGFEPISKPN